MPITFDVIFVFMPISFGFVFVFMPISFGFFRIPTRTRVPGLESGFAKFFESSDFISIGCANCAPDGSSPRACSRLNNSRVQAENAFECLISLQVLFSFGSSDLKGHLLLTSLLNHPPPCTRRGGPSALTERSVMKRPHAAQSLRCRLDFRA